MRTSTSILCAVLLPCIAGVAPGRQSPAATTIAGIKLMKAGVAAPGLPFTVTLPTACQGCIVLDEYRGENDYEKFFHVRVPVGTGLVRGLRVDACTTPIRAVIVEKQRIAFAQSGATVTFDLPVPPVTRSSTVEMQTHIGWPGLALRIEHAFRGRRAGNYANDPWPSVEAAAALNLEFGMREAIRALRLDRRVEEDRLGQLHLMGFDTNYPLGHKDYPPHVHLILRWPDTAGSQAPHLYIGPGGRLTHNTVSIDGLGYLRTTTFSRGAWTPMIDYKGRPLFRYMITSDGGLALEAGSERCTLLPVDEGDTGFAAGARLHCLGRADSEIRAGDNQELGIVQVLITSGGCSEAESYRYDVDTAELISTGTNTGKTILRGQPPHARRSHK